jgi:hypothetical protein
MTLKQGKEVRAVRSATSSGIVGKAGVLEHDE